MINAEQIRAKAGERYASLPLDEFEDWFLRNTWNAHIRSNDQDLVDFVHKIEGLLLDHECGAIGMDTLKKELAAAFRPFAKPQPVVWNRRESENTVLAYVLPPSGNNNATMQWGTAKKPVASEQSCTPSSSSTSVYSELVEA